MPKKPPTLKHLQTFAQEEKEEEKGEEKEEKEEEEEEEEEEERVQKEEQVHYTYTEWKDTDRVFGSLSAQTQTQTHESQIHTHALAMDLLIASLCAYAKSTSVFTLQKESRNRHNKKATRLNTSRWNKFIALIRKCLGALGCEEGGLGGGKGGGADRDWALLCAAFLRRGVSFVPLATASIGVGDDAGGGERGGRGYPDGGGRGRVGGRGGGGNGGGEGGGGERGVTEDWERFGCACLVAGLLSECGVGSGGVAVEAVEEAERVVACFLLAFAGGGGGGEGGAKVENTFYREHILYVENTFSRKHILEKEAKVLELSQKDFLQAQYKESTFYREHIL
jgi:hypothetical protein